MSRKFQLTSAKLFFLVLMCAVAFGMNNTQATTAHPGDTDDYGGHNCRTNCAYWGYSPGYHYHNNGIYEEPNHYQEGYDRGLQRADNDQVSIEQSASFAGAKEGRTSGLEDSYRSEAPDSDYCVFNITFTGNPPQEYEDGFEEAWSERCKEIYEAKYAEAYTASYDLAHEERKREQESSDIVEASSLSGNDSDDESPVMDWFGMVFAFIFIGIPLFWAAVEYIRDR